MTRIAILGNSHIAAYKAALPLIKSKFPDAVVTLYGVNNADFHAKSLGHSDPLRVRSQEDAQSGGMIDIKGPVELDLSAFDRVLLASHGFYLPSYYSILATHDVLDLTTAGHSKSISLAALTKAMQLRTTAYRKKLQQFYNPDSRFVIVQMPFPAQQSVQNIPDIAGTAQQPDADRLMALFNTIVSEELKQSNLNYAPVPSRMIAAPFLSLAQFARANDLSTKPEASDFTHMNAGYALETLSDLLVPQSPL
ncbi:hypothetical protein [Phaeobacter sp. NW0010-22]|uniref:hypothetical protein n=1 Tax=Phaeobacter sp. NW0010-22 TaxID=3135907 RepID=UPI003101ED57